MTQAGSGKSVSDFTTYCEGDVEPSLNKQICALIDCTRTHIVYLDDEYFVEWAFTHEHGKFPAGFDSVANRIGELETISITQLAPSQRLPFARFLAEAMARTLGDRDQEEAQAVLDKAESYLNARGLENARRWYLAGVGYTTLAFFSIGALIFWKSGVGSDPAQIAFGAAVGSVGSLLSIASRTETIHFEPVAGPQIHKFEGATRVIVGVVSALFVAIAIKADLLLGVFHSLTHPLLAMIAACIAAGTSERVVSGLVNNMGKSLSTKRR